MPSVLAVDDGAIEKSKEKMELTDYENAFHSIFKSTPNAVIIYDSRSYGEEITAKHNPKNILTTVLDPV